MSHSVIQSISTKSPKHNRGPRCRCGYTKKDKDLPCPCSVPEPSIPFPSDDVVLDSFFDTADPDPWGYATFFDLGR